VSNWVQPQRATLVVGQKHPFQARAKRGAVVPAHLVTYNQNSHAANILTYDVTYPVGCLHPLPGNVRPGLTFWQSCEVFQYQPL